VQAIFGVILLLLAGLAPALGAGTVELSNEHLQLVFDTATGSLKGFYGPGQKHQYLAPQTNGHLWELRYGDNPTGSVAVLKSTQANSFRIERMGPTALRLIWEGFHVAVTPPLRVEAVVCLEESSALSRWNIVVRQAGPLRLKQILFPCVSDLAPQDDEALAVPVWMGRIVENPRALLNQDCKSRELRYDYPGHTSMQCLAFYRQNGPGFYIACDDTNAYHKTFVFSGDGQDGARFALVQLPAGDAGQDYSQPYAAILGAFSGDWYTAAQLYRAWATNQWWVNESRLHGINDHWAHNTGLWVWNRGPSSGVIEPALVLQRKLKLPVSVMWHWWHQCAYDIGFPEYLPPREGVPSFTNALAKAHRQQVHAIVYMNQRLWGMTTRSWEEASQHAVLGADGKVHPEVYNTFTKSPCASMCLGSAFWRQHYATLAERVLALGVDGIYMDQACSSLACYNPEHGHPLGGGTYWMSGFRTLAADIRNRASQQSRDRQGASRGMDYAAGEMGRRLRTMSTIAVQKPPTHAQTDLALAGEGVGETWLPYLDLMLSLEVSRERYAGPDHWETIPLFQAVYHPYASQYGNYSSLTVPPYDPLWPAQFAPKEPLRLLDRKFSRQFYLEQARAFVWGQQPTIANFRASQLRQRPEEMAYVLRLAKVRSRTLKYLQHGTFLRPPEVRVPGLTIDFIRASIYSGPKSPVTNYCKVEPAALAAAWQAPDGTVGIAVASIHDRALPVSLDMAGLRDQLPEPALVYYVDEKGRRKLGQFVHGQTEIKLEMAKRGAGVVELVVKCGKTATEMERGHSCPPGGVVQPTEADKNVRAPDRQ
jgi:hypothetical protein